MKYDICSSTAPQMPTLGNGTECIRLLLSQTSKDIQEPLVPMLFPVLGSHISGAEFQYPDLSWKEPCGMMANLVAETGGNKGQLSTLVEAICRDFRQHDEEECLASEFNARGSGRASLTLRKARGEGACSLSRAKATSESSDSNLSLT